MSKGHSGAILGVLAPQRDTGETLQRQLYAAIRKAILDGGLPPGTRLPSTRALAAEWSLGRNTVVISFEQLAAEGYLESKIGSGTFVSRKLPEEYLQVLRRDGGPQSEPRPAHSDRVPSARGCQIASTRLWADSVRPAPFAHGIPALDAFPVEVWRRISARVTRRLSRKMLSYQNPAGSERLRRSLAAYLRTARGVKCGWRQILVVSSSQQALDISARMLLDPGDQAWMEEPGYRGARGALTASQAVLVPVPIDAEGLRVSEGRRLAPKARLAYVTPSHQYPMGVTLSLRRRLELLEWASQSGAWILEDDYNSEYRYAGRPLASLQGLDESDCVIYIGTFSKVLFPSLRLGYLVVPPSIVEQFTAARALFDGHSPGVSQAILAEFIEEGHFAAHIRRMRSLYRQRQSALLEAGERHFCGRVRLTPADSGMHLIGRIDRRLDDAQLSRHSAREGLDIAPLSRCYLGPPEMSGFILGYCGIPRHEIERGARQLGEILSRWGEIEPALNRSC